MQSVLVIQHLCVWIAVLDACYAFVHFSLVYQHRYRRNLALGIILAEWIGILVFLHSHSFCRGTYRWDRWKQVNTDIKKKKGHLPSHHTMFTICSSVTSDNWNRSFHLISFLQHTNPMYLCQGSWHCSLMSVFIANRYFIFQSSQNICS